MVEKSTERKLTLNEKCSNRESLSSSSSTMLSDQTIELNFVRNRLETFQDTVLRDVQKRMSGMIDEVMQELRQHQLQTSEFRNLATPHLLYTSTNQKNACHNSSTKNSFARQKEVSSCEAHEAITNEKRNEIAGEDDSSSVATERISPKKQHNLPSKVFVTRESLLTALLEVNHMKTIYHIFYTVVFVFLFNTVSNEYLVKGSVSFGLGTFRSGFGKIHKVAVIWLFQHLFVFCIYYALKYWSNIRIRLAKHKSLQRLFSNSCLFVYIATQLMFVYFPPKICLHLNLPFITAAVLLLETVRLIMKMHSFTKTIVPRIRRAEIEKKKINFPGFNKYLYFLFAPTLLYRDDYPRTSTIRWKFALSRFLEIVAIAFLYNYIYDCQIKYHFGNFCLEELNASSMSIKMFGMLMPAVIIFLTGFYMILHSWLNFTAELLRFGDRLFYRDWWTANNYAAYYRNWNVVVHDWLYEYIYKDCYNHVFKGSKALSSLTVFMISAIFHEYILSVALQVVFPVIFFFFGIVGVIVIFITNYTPKNLGNIFLWFSLIYGSSWTISLYSMEYFTRVNCPKEFSSWTDFLVPHVWSHEFK